MIEGYDMLAIPLANLGGEKRWLVISISGTDVKLDSDLCTFAVSPLPSGWKARPSANLNWQAPIVIRETGGQTLVRLLETETYEWSLEGEGLNEVSVKSPLKDKRKQRWSVRKLKNRAPEGQFTVINYLGFSLLQILEENGDPLAEIPLEFVSQKMDFDTEYRSMTEDIAKFCEQLILTWEAPTSLRFSASNTERARLLLEQFLFLRSFLSPDRLGRLLEVIQRNPHSLLRAEKEWKPAAMARSTDYLSNPGGMLRSWHRRNGRNIPAQVLDVRKEDTHDTPPNRFVKFALAQFRQLCSDVVELKGETSTVGSEACELMQALDAIMAKRFFRDISRLTRLPLDNQTLQKGEGYREVLRAWFLTEAAATLNWKGQEDSYEGSTRDVATLYEYWIFIQLHQILEDIPGIEKLSGDSISGDEIKSFIKESKGNITIHLKSGAPSQACFLLQPPEGEGLRIDLHYERTFSWNKSATSGGSYSRQFRPDYTLSLYPARYKNESAAQAEGKVAHLHFDAKYRANRLGQLFGEAGRKEEFISEEKQESKSISTYQRGDLLKMHTYNDALRQTIGSYVLYPGDGEDTTELRKFHEIAPGVGALVMKPGNSNCLDTLKNFLIDVFEHQSSQFTQQRYLADTRYKTIREDPKTLGEGQSRYNVARPDAPCVLLWLKKNTAEVFREYGFAYCHAVPKDAPEQSKKLDLDLSIEVGSEFLPCGGGQGKPIAGLGWRAKITSARFMSKEKLSEYIKIKGLTAKLKPSSVDHYLIFEFKEATEINKLDLDEVHKNHRSGSKYMAVSCRWRDILNAQLSSC
jgi:predicted component of viral defense system (DUF524 family)